MKISQRAQNITPSATLALSAKAKQMKASGIDVINLSIGEPDFNTPRHVKDAAVAAINEGKSDFYTPATGILELREAIAKFVNDDCNTAFFQGERRRGSRRKDGAFCNRANHP